MPNMNYKDYTYCGKRITASQSGIIELDDSQNLIISGPPESGKTLVALNRAWRLSRAIDPAHGRFAVFMPYGYDMLGMMRKYKLPSQPKGTYIKIGRWCDEQWRRYKLGTLPHYRPPHEIRGELLNYIRGRGNSFKKPFDFSIVIDGHRFDPISLEIIERSSEHITVTRDSDYDPYDEVSSLEQTLSVLRIGTDRFERLMLEPLIGSYGSIESRASTRWAFGQGLDLVPDKSEGT